MSQENVEIVEAIFAAWKDRDPKAALERIHSEVEFDSTGQSFPGEEVRGRGHEALQTLVARWLEHLESIEFFPDHFIDAGDEVIVWFRVTAHGRKSGVPTDAHVAAVYTVRDGMVVRWRVFDTLEAAAGAVGI